MDEGYWTYNEWVEHTVAKIVAVAMAVREEDRAGGWMFKSDSAITQALRHERTGGSDNDPVGR